MKNTPIDERAARDIRIQVDKVLRGLGNPTPPLNLDEVRELLNLDKYFYSSTNTSALRESISKLKIGAKQLALRPRLLLDIVRKADLKALWLPDRKRILIDAEIPDKKKRHTETHEIIHSITPHHQPFLFGDDSVTLRHSCYEALEAEANYGSGQLLFHMGLFAEMAKDMPHNLETVRKLAKVFGNTVTMTLWRLVEEASRGVPLFAVISVHPKLLGDDYDPSNPCRYFIESPEFREQFGNVSEASVFRFIQSYSSRASGGPLGQGTCTATGQDGEKHYFELESFFNRHEALTLGVYAGSVKSRFCVL